MHSFLIYSDDGIGLAGIVIALLFVILFVLAIRSVTLWYFKINSRLSNLEMINDKLDKIIELMSKENQNNPI